MPFQIIRNDITQMAVDAIVNTANPNPEYGSGIDCAVYEGAGKDVLLKARKEIGSVDAGNSVITSGFNLPCKFIIHTVGCAWQDGNNGEEDIVRECYKSAFKLALENNLESIAFPLISSGRYGFPKGIALRIALSEISTFLSENDMDVYLVVFDEKSFELSGELFGGIDSYISQNYVEEKKAQEYEAYFMLPESLDEVTDSDSGPVKNHKRRKSPLFGARAGEAGDGCMPRSCENLFAKPARSLDDCIKNLDKTFMELVFSFADAKGFTDVQVQRQSNLDKKTFSKLKCGNSKNPSKSTALALAVGLELNIDDTKDLLSRAGFALSPCSRRDLIVQYFIEAGVYSIDEINVALFEHDEPLLGSIVKE